MESPHEHQQNLLLSRIISNVERLNESIMLLNQTLKVNHVDSIDPIFMNIINLPM
ncbi:hypothetical protein HI914_04330, partial [Erysiphe necator]